MANRIDTSTERQVTFTIPGRIPSKANYRKENTRASREEWKRILAYESQVARAAMVAGARRHMGRGKACLDVLLVNQGVDLDNALKAPIDGLKGVAFPDDSPEYLAEVRVFWREDLADTSSRTAFRITWEIG